MDKSAIKSFAIEARKILMKSAITQAGFYGVSKDGCAQPTQKGAGFEVYRTIAGTDNRIFGDDIKRREKLVRVVEEKGFDQVIEETAYTWFNRLIAIRFMEVNGYLPTRTRVLSSETGSNTPDLMSQYMDVDLDMTMDELEKVQACVRENRYDDAFVLLFVKQCNALNDILPDLFEKTTDYMELLLKLSYTSDGVVRMLVDTIPESNFDIEQEGQIEIIGWMYQYYNTELKDDTFALLKKNVKITKERIPSATQLFTPDWIVRYMVENSLGRLWIEGHPDEDLKANWKYYLEEAKQEADVQAQLEEIRNKYKNLNPEDIKVIDPCMGSGHILIYCFDVLMQIYESQGYTQRDAAKLILENNLYGLDIDKRATQLAYFAVMMKARQYDRRIFFREVHPHVYTIEESNGINRDQLKYFGANLTLQEKNNASSQIMGLLNSLIDAKEYGSILNIEAYDWELLYRYAKCVDDLGQMSLDTIGIDRTQNSLISLIAVGEMMVRKYHVVITNPPYMALTNAHNKLSVFVKKNYSDCKADLFAVFMERCTKWTVSGGYTAMITQQAWMFLTTFEKLRLKMLKNNITSIIEIGYNSFPDLNSKFAVAAAFVIRTAKIIGFKGSYLDLNNRYGKSYNKEEAFFYEKDTPYHIDLNKLHSIPGTPIAFWLSDNFINAFRGKRIADYSTVITGMTTGKNDLFLRLWYEIDINKSAINYSKMDDININERYWIPYSKGGERRNWYGNTEYLVNWRRKDEFNRSKTTLQHLYLKEALTWPFINIDTFCARYLPKGYLWDVAGSPCFFNDRNTMLYTLGFLCSKVAATILSVINPTVNVQAVDIEKLPLIIDDQRRKEVIDLVQESLDTSMQEWNSYETSWDFEMNPLVYCCNTFSYENEKQVLLPEIFKQWESICEKRFIKIKENEEKLNRIFIDIYKLRGDLTEDVEDRYVTVHKADAYQDIRYLISYAVGCMFGRYSLEKTGLMYAGGKWIQENYRGFLPDKDNCIPITDEEYFEDDIVGLFCNWLKTAFGEKSLEANLDFIAKALGNKGTTSREVIRNYFLNDFIKDHMKIYQKRPIYWMFDSGKQNGFKCLTYMHRYDKDTVGRVRSDYLRKSQEAIEAALKNAEYTIQNSTSAIDKATATKKRDKYIKQLSEIRTYFQALSHVALQRIDIDLDDGVKVNYEKFQNIEIVDENGKKQKINLLTKI